jgi:hypothetical protein
MSVRPDLANLLFISVCRRYRRGRLCQYSPRQSAGLQKRFSQSSLMLPLMRLRKRVFAPRRGAAVERGPPLHFAVSAGAESFVLRRGPGRSAWLTPSSWNPPSPACTSILMARRCSSMSTESRKETPPYIDEWRGDNRLKYICPTVCHEQ